MCCRGLATPVSVPLCVRVGHLCVRASLGGDGVGQGHDDPLSGPLERRYQVLDLTEKTFLDAGRGLKEEERVEVQFAPPQHRRPLHRREGQRANGPAVKTGRPAVIYADVVALSGAATGSLCGI